MKQRDWKNRDWISNEVRRVLDQHGESFSQNEVKLLNEAIDTVYAPQSLLLLLEIVSHQGCLVARRCSPREVLDMWNDLGVPETVTDLARDLARFKLLEQVTNGMAPNLKRFKLTQLGTEFANKVLAHIYLE